MHSGDEETRDYLVFKYEDDVEEYFQTAKLSKVMLYLKTNEITSLSNQSFNLQLSVESSRKFVYLVEVGTTKYFRVHLEYLVKSYVGKVEELSYATPE